MKPLRSIPFEIKSAWTNEQSNVEYNILDAILFSVLRLKSLSVSFAYAAQTMELPI